MADKNDIVKKLSELLKKSEELQKDLKQLSEVILYSCSGGQKRLYRRDQKAEPCCKYYQSGKEGR
jgi:hypothetical protein